MKTDQRSTVMSSGGRFETSGVKKPPRKNLQWAASVLRAKAGIMSSQPMAIAKKVAQKARSKIKRKHGTVPAPSVELQMQLQSISAERAARQLHHLVKQLVQAAKKARTFLVRRQLRKANQTASAPTADERIVALKAVAPAAVARRALDQVGLTEQRVPMGADAQSAARQAETAIRPGLLEECEWRLLATAQVQAQVEKLRQHATEQQGVRHKHEATKRQQKAVAAAAAATAANPGGEASHKDTTQKRKRATSSSIPRANDDVQENSARRGAGYGAKRGPASAAPSRSRASAASSRFVDSLCHPKDDVSEDGDGGCSMALGSTSAIGGIVSRSKEGKPKNIISRSGNRMGQRQRQKLMQLAAEKAGNTQGLGGASSSERGRPGKRVRAGSGGSSSAYDTQPGGADTWLYHKNGRKQQPQQFSAPTAAVREERSAEKLHPSWAAKLHTQNQSAIRAFEGKRIAFE